MELRTDKGETRIKESNGEGHGREGHKRDSGEG